MKKHFIITFLLISFCLLSFNTKAQEEELWNGYDASGVVVIPKAMAQYCEISQEDVNGMGDIIWCLSEILRLKEDPSSSVQVQAQELSNIITRQALYAPIAEGMGIKLYAFEFPKKVLEISDGIQKSVEEGQETSEDGKSTVELLESSRSENEMFLAIAMLENQGAQLQKRLLQAKGAELMLNEIVHFNRYRGRY